MDAPFALAVSRRRKKVRRVPLVFVFLPSARPVIRFIRIRGKTPRTFDAGILKPFHLVKLREFRIEKIECDLLALPAMEHAQHAAAGFKHVERGRRHADVSGDLFDGEPGECAERVEREPDVFVIAVGLRFIVTVRLVKEREQLLPE